MAAVIVGGVTVTVIETGIDHEYEQVGGDLVRMEDTSLRSTIKARKNVWKFVTSLYDSATADTLEAALIVAPPITCSGDLLGASFSCVAVLVRRQRVPIGGNLFFRIHFELRVI